MINQLLAVHRASLKEYPNNLDWRIITELLKVKHGSK